MKTKGFGKLIALVLCMAMAFSVSSTAFAAEPSSNVEAGNGASIVSVDNTLAGDSAVAPIYDNSIPLDAGTGILIPLGTLAVGQTVTVKADWEYTDEKVTTTPSLAVALPLSSQTTFDTYVITGISATVTFTVKTAAAFSLYIGNPSSEHELRVDFDITITA